MNSFSKKWVYLVVLSFIWGSSYILIKKSLVGLTPLQLGSIRILFTTVILYAYGYKTLKRLTKEQWKWIAVTGFIGTFLPSFLFAFSQTKINSSSVSVINGLTPVFALVFAYFIFKSIITKKQVLGVSIGFIGTFVMVFQEIEIHASQEGFYILLAILSTICYGLNVNYLKVKLSNISPITVVLGNFLWICVPALLVLSLSDFPWNNFYTDSSILSSLGYVLILSVFGTAVAKVMFNKMVVISSTLFSISIAYLLPIVAIGWGFIDGESFGTIKWISCALILCGVYLITSPVKKK